VKGEGETIDRSMNSAAALTSEVLILPDGRVLAHNLTPAFTDLLHHLNPEEPHFAARQAASACLTPPASRNLPRARRATPTTEPEGLP
jgi:hypothetical protein